MEIAAGHRIRWGSRLAALAVSAVALTLVFRRLDLPSLWQTLWQVRVHWFVAANLLFGLVSVLAARRWHLMLRLNDSLVHSGATLRLELQGHFFNTFLFGPAGGDFVKTFLYSRWFGYSPAEILPTCVLDRLTGGVGFLILAALTPALAMLGGKPARHLDLPSPQRLLILAAIGAAALAVIILLRRRFGKPSIFLRFLDTLRANANALIVQPRLLGQAVFIGFLAHVCMSSLLLVCLQGVARRPFSTMELLWIFPVISVITATPVTVSGSGLREGAALVLLGLYGIEATDAVAAALLVFGIYLTWALAGGLIVWRNSYLIRRQPKRGPIQNISAVVATLNEAAALPETVRRLRQNAVVSEIIVADGGSTDGTPQIAEQLGCCVVASPPGRGVQMRAGAVRATGDAILFVHADTWLPANAGHAVINCLRDQTVVGGGFWKSFRAGNAMMLGSRWRCLVRLHLFRRIMGDQVIFTRRDTLEKVGGVPEIPLMEDFELSRRMRQAGRLALASATVTTSGRRFAKLGVFRTYLRMWRVTIQYYLGSSPEQLRRIYEKE
jgi:rSAM/selenodomain-associated transferase 2